jgi:hypothetical protein
LQDDPRPAAATALESSCISFSENMGAARLRFPKLNGDRANNFGQIVLGVFLFARA